MEYMRPDAGRLYSNCTHLLVQWIIRATPILALHGSILGLDMYLLQPCTLNPKPETVHKVTEKYCPDVGNTEQAESGPDQWFWADYLSLVDLKP